MSTPVKLESYLVKLDKALGPIAVSEKADIITEIRSHVLEAQKRDEAQSIEVILASLGEPELVANRYLLERGLKPQKAPKHPIVKWLTIGFLGTLSICVVFILIIIWKFTPIIKVDDESGRVIILGGLIDVNEKAGHIKVGSLNINEDSSSGQMSGSMDIDIKKTPNIEVLFQNGKIELENSSKATLEWKCKGVSSNGFVENEKDVVKLNFNNTSNVKCFLAIPTGVHLLMNGSNGKIDFENPRYHVNLKLTNGKISFSEDASSKYVYVFNLVAGKIDDFQSNQSKDSYKIEMNLVNGKIEKN